MPPTRTAAADLYVGIDLGTSGCRACAINHAGDVLGTAQRPLAAANDGHGLATALWWPTVVQVLRELFGQVSAQAIRAIAVDGTSATLLVTDAQGEPLAPALMYNDHRCRAEAEAVAALAPADSPARGASSSLAKLLHLYAQHRHARHALHQADWIAGRLSGRYDVSDENNCLKLGYDPVARCWPDWLRRLPVPAHLFPEVVAPGTIIGAIQPSLARELGLSSDTRIVAGSTDSTAAWLATSARELGCAVTSLGSTMVLKVVCGRPINAARYGIYSHRVGDLWLAGGASNSGGAVLLKYFSRSQLETMTPLLRAEQDSDLDYYPLPARGERFPINDPDLPPRLEPRPADNIEFLHGMLVGMANIEARGYRLLAQLGAPYPSTVCSIGGGAHNPAWQRIRQRALGVPVTLAQHQDAAYGVALLARAGVTAGTFR